MFNQETSPVSPDDSNYDNSFRNEHEGYNKPITPELEALNEVVSGLYRSREKNFRGNICEYFTQNLLVTCLLHRLWHQYIAQLDFPEAAKQEINSLLPYYDKALFIKDGVKIFYYDKIAEEYKPYKVEGEQLVLDSILVRQGFNDAVLAIAVEGPYAGLILSPKRNSLPDSDGGYTEDDISELVVERLLNDESIVETKAWENIRYSITSAKLSASEDDSEALTEEMIAKVKDYLRSLRMEVNAETKAFLDEKRKDNPANDSFVHHIAFLLEEIGVFDKFEDINYQLLPSA